MHGDNDEDLSGSLSWVEDCTGQPAKTVSVGAIRRESECDAAVNRNEG